MLNIKLNTSPILTHNIANLKNMNCYKRNNEFM